MSIQRLIGPDIPSPANDGLGKNNIHGASHACIADAIATEIHAYIGIADGLKFTLTDTSGGVPLNLLTVDNTGQTTASGWNQFDLPSPISVSQSTVYGIAVLSAAKDSITYDSSQTSYTKYDSGNNPYSTGIQDPLSLSTNGTGLLQAQIWGYLPPTITQVNGGNDIHDADTGVSIVGTSFVDSAGNPTVELCENSNYTGTIVEQTVTSNSDTALEITVDATGLSTGTVYMFVTTALGQRNATGFAVTLAASAQTQDVGIAASIQLPAFNLPIKNTANCVISSDIESPNFDSNVSESVNLTSVFNIEEIQFTSDLKDVVGNLIQVTVESIYSESFITEKTNNGIIGSVENPYSNIPIKSLQSLLSYFELNEIEFTSLNTLIGKTQIQSYLEDLSADGVILEKTNNGVIGNIENPYADINITLSSSALDISIVANIPSVEMDVPITLKTSVDMNSLLSNIYADLNLTNKLETIMNSQVYNPNADLNLTNKLSTIINSQIDNPYADLNTLSKSNVITNFSLSNPNADINTLSKTDIITDFILTNPYVDINVTLSTAGLSISISAPIEGLSFSSSIKADTKNTLNVNINEIELSGYIKDTLNTVFNTSNPIVEFDGDNVELKTNNVFNGIVENVDFDAIVSENTNSVIQTSVENPFADINTTSFLGAINIAIAASIPELKTAFNITNLSTITSIEGKLTELTFDCNLQVEDEEMGLIKEDGSIVPNANSYVTVIEARNYAIARGITLTDDDTELAGYLVRGTDFLESYRAEYQGYKTDPLNQELQWPREGVKIDNTDVPSDFIPKELKQAQIELAIEEYNGIDTQPTFVGNAVVEEKIGPITTKFDNKVVYSKPKMEAVEALLKPLLGGNSFNGLGVHV